MVRSFYHRCMKLGAVKPTSYVCTSTFTVNALFQFLERSKETHPLGRAGDPDEVAAAIGKDKGCFKSIDLINIQRKHSLP